MPQITLDDFRSLDQKRIRRKSKRPLGTFGIQLGIVIIFLGSMYLLARCYSPEQLMGIFPTSSLPLIGGVQLLILLVAPLGLVFATGVYKPDNEFRHNILLILTMLSMLIGYGACIYSLEAYSGLIEGFVTSGWSVYMGFVLASFGPIVMVYEIMMFTGLILTIWPSSEGMENSNDY
ncbi:MAG: hypothetical protein GY810_16265 [Aureispira sp.]|nr:hypothetical protein [Aureispira sp.]